MTASLAWRGAFALSGVLMMLGGPRHPRGTMAEMLAHPDWVPSHLFLFFAFVALLVGLLLFGRRSALAPPTRRWYRLAVIGTVLQAIEMALHTASVVDHQNLVAGAPTPVLTTHLALAVAFYPVFGATLIGFMLAAARERSLGSPWITWIGILGALGHGLSAPLVVALQQDWARLLFPALLLVAVWTIVTSCWPVRASAATAAVV